MNARLKADLWVRNVPHLVQITHSRLEHPLSGMVELSLENGKCTLRAVSHGIDGTLTIPAEVYLAGRWVIRASLVDMIARGGGEQIELAVHNNEFSAITARGMRVRSTVAKDMQFPAARTPPQRRVMATDDDAVAWAVVDEPTVNAQANDTIWMGVSPLNNGLYVSAASQSWAAMVRDGQDAQAIPVLASAIRRIRVLPGDILSFDQSGVTIDRSNLRYWVGVVQSPKMDTYPLAEKIIGGEISRVKLTAFNMDRLRRSLKVLHMGSDVSNLIPIHIRYMSGHLFLQSESSTVTGTSAVRADLMRGVDKWEIGVAGDSLLATLSNLDQAELAVNDDGRGVGALAVWRNRLVSIRASLRMQVSPLPVSEAMRLITQAAPAETASLPEVPSGVELPDPDPDPVPEPD